MGGRISGATAAWQIYEMTTATEAPGQAVAVLAGTLAELKIVAAFRDA